MRSILAVRRAWPARLVAAVLFAVGAAALANAAGGPDSGGVDRTDHAELGSPFTFAPSIAQPRSAGGAEAMDRSRTFHGTTVVVSAGPWTPEAIYEMLAANGLGPTMGKGLTVRVQAAFPPTRVTTSGVVDPVSGSFADRATMWLDAWPRSDFSRRPDRTIAHQIGLVWIAQFLEGNTRFWAGYLDVRGIAGDGRLDSSETWAREEILADDYRLLFGAAAAIDQQPTHMNPALTDPRSVAGLREFLAASLPDPV